MVEAKGNNRTVGAGMQQALDYSAIRSTPTHSSRASPQDLSFTTKLLGIGEALGVEVLDHIIVTTNSFPSFKQRALL